MEDFFFGDSQEAPDSIETYPPKRTRRNIIGYKNGNAFDIKSNVSISERFPTSLNILNRKLRRKILPIELNIGAGKFPGNLKLPNTSPTVKII